MQGFRYDAHPMGMLVGSVGALSTFYPDAKDDPRRRHAATSRSIRLIAKMPTLAAFAFRHAMGQPYVYPDNDLELRRQLPLDDVQDDRAEVRAGSPARARARHPLHPPRRPRAELLHERGPRRSARSQVDPYSAVAAGVAALYGPLHGGANEAVLRMLRRIGSRTNIPDFIEGVKAGNERLMGFGHRVYKNYDPRARIIKQAAEDVFEVTGQEPAARDRDRARADRARGRLLRLAQALPERRLLLGPDLRGHGPAGRDVPGDVRDRPHERLDRPVARDDRRTRSRRSPARARSTRAPASATTCRWRSARAGPPLELKSRRLSSTTGQATRSPRLSERPTASQPWAPSSLRRAGRRPSEPFLRSPASLKGTAGSSTAVRAEAPWSGSGRGRPGTGRARRYATAGAPPSAASTDGAPRSPRQVRAHGRVAGRRAPSGRGGEVRATPTLAAALAALEALPGRARRRDAGAPTALAGPDRPRGRGRRRPGASYASADAGPARRPPAGVDLHADRTTTPWTGPVQRRPVEVRPGETAYEALARVLGP